jgi:tetratricopeptide (TPR) repeat protein
MHGGATEVGEPRLALVMIARDEARCIERALASARPWVDEMVVLDTGSRDATPAIAARCGARVASFDWIDDFAAARNAALGLTGAAWRLVLDADEWIAGGAGCLAQLRDAAPDHVGSVSVASSYDGDAGVAVAPSWLPRLLPRGVHYAGRIHEQPDLALPRRRWPLSIGHDGYRAAQMHAKGDRNARLLAQAVAQTPADAYLRYQFGKDHEVHGRWAEAAPHYRQALADTDACAVWRHDLVLRMLFTLKKLGRHAEALQLAESEMPHWPHSPDFSFTVGDLLLDWAASEPAHAATLLPVVEQSWLRALEIGENPALPDSVPGRGSFLAATNLAVLHDGLGDAAQAAAWRERAAALRGAVAARG